MSSAATAGSSPERSPAAEAPLGCAGPQPHSLRARVGLLLAALAIATLACTVQVRQERVQTPSGSPVAVPTPAEKDQAPAPDLEERVRERINAIRQDNGLAPLEPHAELAGVARDYSCRMARESFFAHTAPGGETAADRVREAGIPFRTVGENIAMNVNALEPVNQAVEGWMQSEGHRENILREVFTHTGLGVCRRGSHVYFTQLFLRPA